MILFLLLLISAHLQIHTFFSFNDFQNYTNIFSKIFFRCLTARITPCCNSLNLKVFRAFPDQTTHRCRRGAVTGFTSRKPRLRCWHSIEKSFLYFSQLLRDFTGGRRSRPLSSQVIECTKEKKIILKNIIFCFHVQLHRFFKPIS